MFYLCTQKGKALPQIIVPNPSQTFGSTQWVSCPIVFHSILNCYLFCYILISHLDEMNVTPSVASGVLMAVRVLRYLACPVEKSNTTEGWLTRWSVKLSYWRNVVTWGLTPQRDDYLRFPRVKLEKIRKILGTDYDQIRMFQYIFTSSRSYRVFMSFETFF